MTETQEETPVITREEYVRRLEAAYRVCEEIRGRYGWCEQWMPRLLSLTRDFRPRREDRERAEVHVDGQGTYERALFTDDGWVKYEASLSARYGEELTRIRGRVLTIARQETITLQDANQVISALGLPPYGELQGRAYTVERLPHTIYVRSDGNERETTAAVGTAYRAFLNEVHAILGATTGMDFPALRVRVARLGSETSIPASECVALL